MRKNGVYSMLKKAVYSSLAVASLACSDPPVAPMIPPEVIIFSASPLSGRAPLEVSVLGDCSDDKGISEYRLKVGSTMVRGTNPVDTILTLEKSIDLGFSCVDTDLQEVSASPKHVEVLQPGFSQNAMLENDADIRYNATLVNLDSAKVRIFRNGNLVDSLMVRTPTFTRLFSGSNKGNYEFISEANRLNPDTAKVIVPNYIPTITGITNVMLPEGSATTINLPQATDRNLEDNPVPYVSAVSRRNKVTPTLNGNQLHLKADSVGAGADTIDVRFGSQAGGFGNEVIPVNVQDLLDISGNLQDLRTNVGSQGEVAIYAFPDTSLLGKFTTDENGNFSFRLGSLLQRDSVYLQARIGTPLDNNFVRTIALPNRDATGLIVRAYPYNSDLSANGISRDEIRAHLQELNPGFFKWNLDSLRGVEIIDVDPLGRGSFTREEQDAIEQTFRANLSCYTSGRLNENNLLIQKDIVGSERHYTANENGIALERNWIYVFPDTTLINTDGITNTIDDGNGIINLGSIRMKDLSQFVISHEQGHAFIAPNNHHATTLSINQTIMGGDVQSPLTAPSPVDCEAGKIIYEDTFRPRESYDRTLGLDFFRQYNSSP